MLKNKTVKQQHCPFPTKNKPNFYKLSYYCILSYMVEFINHCLQETFYLSLIVC